MQQHSTNYYNTFIEVAEDSRVAQGVPPPSRPNKSIAERQFEMISAHPYKYTSDEVFFQVYADRNDLVQEDYEVARAAFFSKGQPCFRASPLTRTYGFGVHSDAQGRVALYAMESEAYQKLLADPSVAKVKAMRTKR